jgi:glycosyltransferase involved in cell wall biosynthesis
LRFLRQASIAFLLPTCRSSAIPRVPLLALSDDVEALTQQVLTLVADPERRRRLGEGARQLSRRFEWDHIAEETLALYLRILSP